MSNHLMELMNVNGSDRTRLALRDIGDRRLINDHLNARSSPTQSVDNSIKGDRSCHTMEVPVLLRLNTFLIALWMLKRLSHNL
jgi:hypothetical protein